jgi:hypothetical protein
VALRDVDGRLGSQPSGPIDNPWWCATPDNDLPDPNVDDGVLWLIHEQRHFEDDAGVIQEAPAPLPASRTDLIADKMD